MSVIAQAYNEGCSSLQHFLESHSPVELPGGILRSVTQSFAVSFIFSTIFSGGNVGIGVIGGGLGALASVISVIAHIALQQLQNGLSKFLGKPKQPLPFEGRAITNIIGITGALLCGDAAGFIKPEFGRCLFLGAVWIWFTGPRSPREMPSFAVPV